MTVTFDNFLDARNLKENTWRLNRPYYATVYMDGKRYEISIAKGFVTDFCSVPRIPFVYALVGGIAQRAGCLHDALYSPWNGVRVVEQETWNPAVVDRAWADMVLRCAVVACGIPAWKAQAMYIAVRLFGGKFYKVSGA